MGVILDVWFIDLDLVVSFILGILVLNFYIKFIGSL